MKIEELKKFIQETIQESLLEIDKGDRELNYSVDADNAMVQLDQKMEMLKQMAKRMREANSQESVEMLKAINNSLEPFLTKVALSLRNKKV